jgi:hypothetical protein
MLSRSAVKYGCERPYGSFTGFHEGRLPNWPERPYPLTAPICQVRWPSTRLLRGSERKTKYNNAYIFSQSI